MDAAAVAAEAYVWGYPLVACARIRVHTTNPQDPYAVRSPASTGAPINRWGHQHVPADPTFRAGPGPSVDLLYSSVRLDLDTGPFVIEAPECGDRYYTMQIAFADSSAEHSLGRRTHGSQLPPVAIVGPRHRDVPLPGEAEVVHSPTRYCQVPFRLLFDPGDASDLDRVRQLQSQLRVRTLDAYRAGVDAPAEVVPQRPLRPIGVDPDDDLCFLHELGSVLQDWVVEQKDEAIVAALTRIGLTPQKGFDPTSLDEASLSALSEGLAAGRAQVLAKSHQLGTEHEGWTTNYVGPRFGEDNLLRAGVAKDQIIVTIPEEAIYPVARCDRNGRPLHGSSSYTWQLAGEQLPPVGAFWSVTAYDDDGHLVENPLDRHAISLRTPGLVRSSDGGLHVTVSHHPPQAPMTNWLPAPEGPFYLMMRLYLPGEAVLDGTWQPPGLAPAADGR